jgi:GR25 family glycosyltransferase involved in LPS biosynthesis
MYYINLERRPDRNIHFINECKTQELPMDKVFRVNAIDGMSYVFSMDEYSSFKNADFLHLPRTIVHKLMGNQLSHYYILHDIIQNNYKTCIILQDDAIFIPEFKKYIDVLIPNIPDDAEIVNIGLHKVAEYSYFESWEFTPLKNSIRRADEFSSKLPVTDLYGAPLWGTGSNLHWYNTTTNDVDKISKEVVNPYICKMKPDMNPCSLAYIVTLQGAKNMIAYFNEIGFKKATDHNFNEYLIEKDIFYSSNIILVTGNPSLGSDIFT